MLATREVPIRWRLTDLQIDRGVSNKRLSELTGMHPNAIANLKGREVKRIDADTLAKFCSALSCQPGDLLEYVED